MPEQDEKYLCWIYDMGVGYLSNMPIVRYISIGRADRVKRGQVLSASTPRAPGKKNITPY